MSFDEADFDATDIDEASIDEHEPTAEPLLAYERSLGDDDLADALSSELYSKRERYSVEALGDAVSEGDVEDLLHEELFQSLREEHLLPFSRPRWTYLLSLYPSTLEDPWYGIDPGTEPSRRNHRSAAVQYFTSWLLHDGGKIAARYCWRNVRVILTAWCQRVDARHMRRLRAKSGRSAAGALARARRRFVRLYLCYQCPGENTAMQLGRLRRCWPIDTLKILRYMWFGRTGSLPPFHALTKRQQRRVDVLSGFRYSWRMSILMHFVSALDAIRRKFVS